MKKYWIAAWAALYVFAVATSVFWPASVVSTLVGIAFFLPPAVLLWDGFRSKNKKQVKCIRILSAASLAVTTILVIVIFLTVSSEKNLDRLMDMLLILCAAPMMCFKAWLWSLFGWACLLSASFVGKKR